MRWSTQQNSQQIFLYVPLLLNIHDSKLFKWHKECCWKWTRWKLNCQNTWRAGKSRHSLYEYTLVSVWPPLFHTSKNSWIFIPIADYFLGNHKNNKYLKYNLHETERKTNHQLKITQPTQKIWYLKLMFSSVMLLEVLPLLFNYHKSKICTWYSRVIGTSNLTPRVVLYLSLGREFYVDGSNKLFGLKNAALEYAIQVGPIGLQCSHFSAIAGARSLQFSRWTWNH